MKHRSRADVVRDILQILASDGPSGPTHIMFRAEISYSMFNEIIGDMQLSELLAIEPYMEGGGRKIFRITGQGSDALELLKKLSGVLGGISKLAKTEVPSQ